MIEIKCSKAQFERFMDCFNVSYLTADNKCILGKSWTSCPATNGKNPDLRCAECLRKNIKRSDTNDRT